MAITGTATTFNLTVGTMIDMEPMIALLDPFDTPLLNGAAASPSGTAESALSNESCFEVKVEWLDESSLTPRTVNGTAAATTGQLYVTVKAGEQKRFQTDDVILTPKGEYILVTGYGTTTDSLVVTRSFNSSTADTIASGDSLVGIGTATVEGADPQKARARDRTDRINYTQIFGPYAVTVSGTEMSVRKYGLTGNEFDYQMSNRTKEGAVALEQALIYGTQSITTTTGIRTMGGIAYYITTNSDTSTTTLTEAKLLDQMQACFDAGGAPDRILSGSKQKRTISAFTSAGTVQVFRTDGERGTSVDTFRSDFGLASVILDRWMRTQDLFIFNRDQAKIATLRPWNFKMLAQTGDAQKGELLCEKSLRFFAQAHAAKFTALT